MLTKKLHEINEGNDGWIWRFVKTDDPYIEDEELVYNRDSQISVKIKSVSFPQLPAMRLMDLITEI